MSRYNAEQEWTNYYKKHEIMYPAEDLIRIFKGTYPRLDLKKNQYKNKKICDIGCGDGRNLIFLDRLGFNTFGTEITKTIVDETRKNLQKLNISSDIRVGQNDQIPFDKNSFHFVLAWNSCYYMGENLEFSKHVKEIARITKKGGYLILSIPKKTHVYFKGSKLKKKGYRIIKQDPLNVRNGEVLRVFQNEKDIQNSFSKYFHKFVFASSEDDCFGWSSHWHLVVCQRNNKEI